MACLLAPCPVLVDGMYADHRLLNVASVRSTPLNVSSRRSEILLAGSTDLLLDAARYVQFLLKRRRRPKLCGYVHRADGIQAQRAHLLYARLKRCGLITNILAQKPTHYLRSRRQEHVEQGFR